VKKRVKNIFKNLGKKLDVVLIKNPGGPCCDDNFFYVTGLDKGIFEGAIALIYPDGGVDLLVSELEAEAAKKADANLYVYRDKKTFDGFLKKLLSDVKKVGLNFDMVSHRDFCKLKEQYKKLSFIDVSENLAKTRLVKDELEIKLIRRSCQIVDKVMKTVLSMLYEGMHEYEVAAEIDYLMQKNGADKPAFETISSFGRNTAEPHYSHGATRLRKGFFVLFDFGSCYHRYNSDITRTFVFGKAYKKQREMYETVLEAQKVGLDSIKPGVKAYKVHNNVSNYIEKTRFRGCFVHSTGHSLGLSVHDGAGFSSESKFALRENMVFTIEPGVYVPGFGGVRIEDDVLIKKNGVEVLTKSPKGFFEI
jgi:Xaa-Pro dipeptidase